jgi:hypothetical protein
MVNWQYICHPKSQGGLGVINIKAMNIALMAQWIWRIHSEQNSDLLWLKLLKANYRVNELFSSNPVGCSPFCLHKIKNQFRLGGQIPSRVRSSISFWNDLWIGEKPLSVRFPSLFQKSLDTDITIAQAYTEEGWWIPFCRNLDPSDV